MMKLMLFMIGIMFIVNMMNFNFIYNLMFIMMIILMLFNNYNNLWMNMYYFISSDFMSFMMSLLTIYIISLMLMVKVKKMMLNYMIIIMLLMLILLLCFNVMNYFMYYLFFEMSLVPTFILIMGWGYQPELVNASIYMLMYTLFASLPLLLMMFILMNNFNSMNLYFLKNISLLMNLELLIYLIMILAFLVKLPVYMMHLWLPKAHVEAPVVGSMILAGVMLKLGGYGIVLCMFMMLNLCKNFNLIMMILGLIGMFNLSILCLCQNDLKSLIAYSSVVHMMMMLMGLMFMNKMMIIGGLLMMISHGFCSSGLFYLVNLNYEKLKSLNLLINKGLMMIYPSLSMWWFMFCMMNMSSPPSMNLVSELLIMMGMFNWSLNIIIILGLIMLLSMMYSLYIFSYSQHGQLYMNLKILENIKLINFVNLIMHWLPINLYFLNMNFLL